MFWIKCSKASTPRPENNVQRARVRSCVLVTIRLLGPLLLLIRLLLRLIRICLKFMVSDVNDLDGLERIEHFLSSMFKGTSTPCPENNL